MGRRSLLPQRRHRLAFQALRELQSMQIFFTSVIASASGNRAISSPAGREREMPYITLTAPAPYRVHPVMNRMHRFISEGRGEIPGFTVRSLMRRAIVVAAILFPILVVMFLTLSGGTVAAGF